VHRQLGFLTPRSIAILVILLVLLVVPLWWLSNGAKKQGSQHAAEKAAAAGSALTPSAASAPAAVNDPDAHGMTWGILPNEKLPESAVWMSCHGSPKDGISQPHADSCNPYRGDSSCRLALPVLCIKKDGSTPESILGLNPVGTATATPLNDERKAGAITLNDVTPDGWAAGSVASTEPVAGFILGSLEGANARCEKELGAGWRMASFHDGSGGRAGWGFVAQRNLRLDSRWRHWVHVADQPGNCWNNKG
jgi:hypothetical protein